MESSVTSLMEHLNGVETRRRVVMMKRKEAETRLAFVTEEHQRLEQRQSLCEVREVELKKELDHLLDEQRQIQLQLMTGADTVRQSEVEEALLVGHVQSQVNKSEALVAEWTGHMEELDSLQKSWGSDDVAIPLQKRISALEKDVARLYMEKEKLEGEVKEASLQASKISAVSTARLAPATVGPQEADCEEECAAVASQLKEQLESEQHELEELQAQSARQLAVLDREVADLSGRSIELEQWLADTVGSRDQTLSSIQVLPLCLEHKLCVSCNNKS